MDDDDAIKKGVRIDSILVSIKNVMITMFGGDYEIIQQMHQLKGSSDECPEILFKNNPGKFTNLTDTIRSFKKNLNKIPELEINYKIQNINKVMRGYSSTPLMEVVVFKLFYDDECILEFVMNDMFVNYKSPIIGLSYAFDVPTKYRNFIEFFKTA